MEYIIRGLTFALIPLIVSGVLAILRRPKKAEQGKVFMPKFFAILGSICSGIFLIPTFICAFSDEPIWTAIAFLLFSMLGASLIVAYINCRISYDEDGFTAKNFFGIKRRFTYDQITGIKENMHETYLYMGKKRIMIDEFAVGGMEFIWFAHQKHRKLHKKPIPEIQNKKDIFNGNIESPGEFIFIFILMGIICLGMLITIGCIAFWPTTPNNTTEQQVILQDFQTEEDQLILKSTDGQIYKINSANKIKTETITVLCDGKTEVTAYVKQYNSEEGNPYYSVEAIAYRDTYLLSFDETNRLNRLEALPILAMFLAFNLIWGFFVAGTIIVGRNPTKYSPKTVKFFFKPQYVKNYSEVIKQYGVRKRK